MKPKITISAVGSSTENGAGCCVTLEFEDVLKRKSKSVVSHPIGIADEVLADVRAAHLGLGSVIRSMRKQAHVDLIVTANVASVLSGNASVDDDAKAELQRWMSYYGDLKIVVASRQDIKGNDAAVECASNQKGFYSKTEVMK